MTEGNKSHIARLTLLVELTQCVF